MTVQVKTASFGAPVTAYVDDSMTWTLPAVGTALAMQWDSNLNVTENTPPPTGDFPFKPPASAHGFVSQGSANGLDEARHFEAVKSLSLSDN